MEVVFLLGYMRLLHEDLLAVTNYLGDHEENHHQARKVEDDYVGPHCSQIKVEMESHDKVDKQSCEC